MDQAEVRRGWVKLHISCDIANHLSVEVTDEHTANGKEFSKLVNGAMDKVNKVFGDSAYDSRDNFSAGHGRRACNKAQLHWKIEGLGQRWLGSSSMIQLHGSTDTDRGGSGVLFVKARRVRIISA
ncbi:MAG: hypothetical protein QXG99_00525 [Conexivisphaerales archaeon]